MLLPSPQSHAKEGRVKQQPPERANRHCCVRSVARIAATEKGETHKRRHGEEGSSESKCRSAGAPSACGMPRRGRLFGRGKEARGEGDREDDGSGRGDAGKG